MGTDGFELDCSTEAGLKRSAVDTLADILFACYACYPRHCSCYPEWLASISTAAFLSSQFRKLDSQTRKHDRLRLIVVRRLSDRGLRDTNAAERSWARLRSLVRSAIELYSAPNKQFPDSSMDVNRGAVTKEKMEAQTGTDSFAEDEFGSSRMQNDNTADSCRVFQSKLRKLGINQRYLDAPCKLLIQCRVCSLAKSIFNLKKRSHEPDLIQEAKHNSLLDLSSC